MDSGSENRQKSKAEKYESVLIVVTQPMSPEIERAIWRCCHDTATTQSWVSRIFAKIYCSDTAVLLQTYRNIVTAAGRSSP
eukprot:8630425-Ditylum_brightwellii.AAC.1